MATQLQIRRGTSAQIAAFTGAEGEIVVNTTNDSVHVNDGSTAGGFEMARADLNNVSDTSLNAALTGNTVSALTVTALTTAGVTTTGDISFGDNDKAIFGAGSDLQIYHDGSNSYIDENGTGHLFVRSNGDGIYFRSNTNEEIAHFNVNGSVKLYHDNAVKLATTSTGVDVTGSVTADGLTVDKSGGNIAASFINSDSNNSYIQFQNSTTGTTTYTDGSLVGIDSDESLTIWQLESNHIKFGTSATERLRIDSSGNVGIGTQSPNRNLHIIGQYTVENSAGSPTGALLFIPGSDANRIYSRTANASSSSRDLAFLSGSTEAMRISGGNVGIGRSPRVMLDVAGEAAIAYNATYGLRFYNQDQNNWSSIGNNVATGSSTATLVFKDASGEAFRLDGSGNLLVGTTQNNPTSSGVNVAGQEFSTTGGVRSTVDANPAATFNRKTDDGTIALFRKDGSTVGSIACRSSGGNLQIHTNQSGIDFGGDGYLPMRGSTITDNSLDIGSSSFRYKDLYLSGAVNLANDVRTSSDNFVYSYSGSTSSQVRSGFKLEGSTSTLEFYTGSVERMRIDSAGRLLHQTTSSTTYPTNNVFAMHGVGGEVTLKLGGFGGSHTMMQFLMGGNNVKGSIVSTGSATSYNTSSDQRLKENIQDADDAGSKIDAIQVRKFDWIADGSHQDYGMIAQELQTVAPEAVSAPEDPEEMMGVDYSKLVPMLVKEIQSLRARVAQLENN